MKLKTILESSQLKENVHLPSGEVDVIDLIDDHYSGLKDTIEELIAQTKSKNTKWLPALYSMLKSLNEMQKLAYHAKNKLGKLELK